MAEKQLVVQKRDGTFILSRAAAIKHRVTPCGVGGPGGGPGGGGALKEAEDGEVLPPPGLLLPLVGKACAGLPNNPQLSPAPPVPSPGLHGS